VSQLSFETHTFFRGIDQNDLSAHPTIKVVNKSRDARDTPRAHHLKADEWFFRRFGVKYRSQSVFVTGDFQTASCYARYSVSTERSAVAVVRVLPLSTYRYCWSPHYRDLGTAIGKHANVEEIENVLDGAGYCEDRLDAAHASGHEVMLHCDCVLYIPSDLLKLNAAKNIGSLILKA
jgi:hypothetical protein